MASSTANTNGIKIGWDIGIKNMSYCRVRPMTADNIFLAANSLANMPLTNIITIGANSYQIVGWEIINVVPKVNQFIHDQGEITLDMRPVVKCCAPKTTKSKKLVVAATGSGDVETCGKAAAHCLVSDPNIGYCNTHYTANAPPGATTTVEILPTSCRCWYHETVQGSSAGQPRCQPGDGSAAGQPRCQPGDGSSAGQPRCQPGDGSAAGQPRCQPGDGSAAGQPRCQTGAVILSARNPYIGYCRKHIPSCGLPTGEQLKIIRSRKVASLDLTMLASALYDELDARPDVLVAEDVLLENQPVLKNPTMKTMQTFLYSYYVMRGVQRPTNGIKTVGDIRCYCASNKLDIIKLLPTAAATDILRRVKEVKSGYSRNKKMAVYICQYLLEQGTGCADLAIKFVDKKKQDDLADSLLMTLHFFERAGLTKLRAGEAKTRAKAAKSGAPIPDSGAEPDERQDLLTELLPKRGGGKAKLAVANEILPSPTTIINPSTATNTSIGKTKSKNSKSTSKSTPEQQTNSILTKLAGKISINLDSPTVSDSSLSDVD